MALQLLAELWILTLAFGFSHGAINAEHVQLIFKAGRQIYWKHCRIISDWHSSISIISKWNFNCAYTAASDLLSTQNGCCLYSCTSFRRGCYNRMTKSVNLTLGLSTSYKLFTQLSLSNFAHLQIGAGVLSKKPGCASAWGIGLPEFCRRSRLLPLLPLLDRDTCRFMTS